MKIKDIRFEKQVIFKGGLVLRLADVEGSLEGFTIRIADSIIPLSNVTSIVVASEPVTETGAKKK